MGNASEAEGHEIGELFKNTITDVTKKVPKGLVGAVDIEVNFKALTLQQKGLSFIFSNTKTKESTVEIKLATRIYLENSSTD